jgi:uroporphyrinogen decarboxylase
MMRQAGRSLPEYRALKEGYKFTELVQNPELAAEVTLQPIRRFGYDAAVIFSDILVVAEAMGQKYELLDAGGVKMDFQLNSKADVDKLDPSNVLDHISYTPEAIKVTRRELGNERAIIGFAGSPWTLASFMVEGGSSRENLRSRAMIYNEPKLFHALLEKITEATITYLKAQIEAGADVIQLFDSQGGTLSPNKFWDISGRWMQQIVEAIDGEVPVIVFARNVHQNWEEVVQTGGNALGIDWSISLSEVCKHIPANVAVQGNMDPALLIARPEEAAAEASRICEEMRGRNGFIFNLGHGVPPEADIEVIQAIAETVQNFK